MRFKKILAGVMTFAVAITAAATPLGNMLPVPTVTQEASAAHTWSTTGVGQIICTDEALTSIKSIMRKQGCTDAEMARFDKILSEFPLSGYFNSKITSSCNHSSSTSTCRSTFYDDETKKTIELKSSQCFGFARYCYYRFCGYREQDSFTKKSFSLSSITATELKNFVKNTNLRPGTHFRYSITKNGNKAVHSMCYLTSDDTYMYFIDANASTSGHKDHTCGNCKIHLHRCTYSQLVDKVKGGSGSGDYFAVWYAPKTKFATHTHSYTYMTSKSATCTTEGLEIGTCSCGLTNTRTIAALGHNYAENYEAAHPHNVYKKCTRCGDYYYTGDCRYGEISSNNAVAATCTSAGKQSDTKCNVCGKTIKTGATIAAKGHSYGAWTTVSAPNFVQGGTEKRTCSTCGAVETRSTSKNTMSMGKVTTSSDCSKINVTFPTIPLAEGYTIKRSDGVTVANVKDPAYYSCDIDGYNDMRYAGQNIIYTSGGYLTEENGKYKWIVSGTKVQNNKWGVECAVDKTGTIIKIREYLSETQLDVPEGGFVFSMHSNNGMINVASIGDKVTYDKATNKLMLSVMSDKCHLFKIDNYNAPREARQTIIYTSGGYWDSKTNKWIASGTKVNTNKWGVEFAVDKTGTVIQKREYCSETQLYVPEDGFVVSTINGANGEINDACDYMISNVVVGDKITYDKTTNTLIVHTYLTKNYTYTDKTAKSGTSYTYTVTPYIGSVTGNGSTSSAVSLSAHKSVSANNAKAATCTAAGKESDTKCSVCGVTITTGKTIAAKGHSYGSWTTTKAATCTATGTQTRSCSACGNKETQTIAATGHKSVSANNGKAATCTATGKESDTKCSVCGVTITTGKTIAAKGHSYGSWTTTKAATCTATGTQTRSCSACGNKETKTVAATGHKSVSANNAKAATCTAAGKESDTKCSVCGVTITTGKTIAAKGHSYGSWTTTKAATCTATGTQTRSCSACGNKETKTVAATGHKYTTKVVAPTTTAQGYTLHTCSVCGSSYKDNYVDKIQLSVPDVTGLRVAGKAPTALRIAWNKNNSADGYIVEMYNNGKWTRMLKISSNSLTEYKKTALKQGTTYKFRIKAYKMNGKTAVYSGYTTVSGTTTVANVTGLKMTARSKTAVRFGWNKNASASGYIVEMYKNGKWVRAAKIANNSTVQFRKTGLTPGTKYQFRVKAYKTTGSTTLYSGYTNLNISTT